MTKVSSYQNQIATGDNMIKESNAEMKFDE